MLSIPESVQTLFKLDGVHKNFRVHFPNGEHADLTNKDVVRESVVFRESVCSRGVLRFGLTEASTISFETVGVPNIMGVTVECSCEIDTSSLTAAEIAAIQAGMWDGTLVLAADSDLGYGFFRVPYGVFRVEECPRNHGAVAHRKVVAYSAVGGGGEFEGNPFEVAKLGLMLPGDTYEPNAYLLAMSNLGYKDPGFMTRQGFQRTELVFSRQTGTGGTIGLRDDDGVYLSVTHAGTRAERRDTDPTSPVTAIYSIELHGEIYDKSVYVERMRAVFAEHNVHSIPLSCPTWEALFDRLFNKIACFPYLRMTADNQDTLDIIAANSILLTEDNYAIYPLRNATGYYMRSNFSIPVSCTLDFGDGPIDLLQIENPPTVYKYEGSVPDLTLLFRSTASTTVSVSTSTHKYLVHSFSGAVKISDFVNGFLELLGMFGRSGRDGSYTTTSFDTASDVDVSPGQYEEAWWDEYDIEPVGTIKYAYTDASGTAQEVSYTFGSGKSLYEMTDNAALLGIKGGSPASIEQMLLTQFVPHLQDVTFTPAEITMIGLPYMEAGDHITLEAEDGTLVQTYALNLTISGIQRLTAEIVSEGGQIIDTAQEGEL